MRGLLPIIIRVQWKDRGTTQGGDKNDYVTGHRGGPSSLCTRPGAVVTLMQSGLQPWDVVRSYNPLELPKGKERLPSSGPIPMLTFIVVRDPGRLPS